MEYGAYFVAGVESFGRSIDLDNFRLRNENQLLILDDLKISKISVDKVTQFDIITSELRELVDNLEINFCWFVISRKVK